MRLPPAAVVEVATRFRNLVGRSHSKMQPAFGLVLERLFGLVDNKMLGLLVELEIPDLLHAGPKSADELAAATNTDADALDRMLRFLVARDLLSTSKDGRYENNDASDVLRRDHPYSWRGWVQFFASDWNWDIWSEAMSAFTEGSTPTESALGAPFFDYVNAHQDADAAFNGAMQAGSLVQALILQENYDFSGVGHVCDVGGGTGAVLATLLNANPLMRGTLFELPTVAEVGRGYLGSLGVLDRCEIVGGDFFDSVPVTADLYTLFAVVHDWGDDEVVTILGNVRASMQGDARVLVIEGVIPDNDNYHFAKVSDLLMLMYTEGGRERTLEQFQSLFARAGFTVAKVKKLPSLFRVFELSPA